MTSKGFTKNHRLSLSSLALEKKILTWPTTNTHSPPTGNTKKPSLVIQQPGFGKKINLTHYKHTLATKRKYLKLSLVIERATCRPKSRCQSHLSIVSVLANKNLHQDLMHSGCRGTAVPNVCLQAFSLFPFPSSLLDQRPVHRLHLCGRGH